MPPHKQTENLRYFLDLFGCVKNQVDAENMMAHLDNAEWKNAPNAENADLIIVNSCGFIESAKKESIDAVIEWRKLYPEKKILLAGCLAQRYAKELAESLPEADGFFGVDNIAQIAEIASKLTDKKRLLPADIPSAGERPLLSLPGSAYVKISEGCNNRCSYCAIPLIRGSQQSRMIPEILEECRILLKRGIKELCIIAQDIGSFGMDTAGIAQLPELLNAISSLEGHFWVRLLYIHPDNFPLQILDVMEKDRRILPYFDIPFQHASQKIIAAMNRRGTAKKYLELLETIRSRLTQAVIRSTFMLGFPSETEEDFAALLDFQEKANLDWLGCFTYSREEGTGAFSMKNQVPKKIAAERRQIIEERQIPITEKNLERFIDCTAHTLYTAHTPYASEVLVEEWIDSGIDESALPNGNEESIWLGRLYCQAPEVDGSTVIVCNKKTDKVPKAGELIPCKVTTRHGYDLEVEI